MRVHRLEITAFGPFPDTEVVDFDELNESGFFLLTGPTGAGKTSILDAICFGLYGAVPGVRNNAKDLKSHHAPPHEQPVVELEVTLRDRRFRFRRTPSWRRPSRRAKIGYVDENASVQAAELIDGEWVSRGTRLDEVGLLVTRVLGMSKEQFCQVVMLPQGQFETFLRSGAKERHDVLEALFHTGRFQQIEKWLADHRRRCDQASREHEDRIQLLLARIEEANGSRWYDEDATPREAAAALGRQVSGLELATEGLREQLDAAADGAKHHDHAVSEAELLTKRQTDHAEAERQLHELESLRETVHDRERKVARARLADKLTPQLTLLDDSVQQHLVLAHAADNALARAVASQALASPDDAGLADARAHALRARIAELTAAREIDDAVANTNSALAEAEAALTAASGTLAESEHGAHAIPGVLAAARVELDAAQRNAARLEALELRHRDAAKIHNAAAELPLAQTELDAARAAERLAHDQHLRARSALVDIREARISSMAAHLASQLSPGAECPVCGNVEHPRPATIDAAHVTEADEDAASLAAQEAGDLHAAARTATADHEGTVAALTAAAGGVDEPTAGVAVTRAVAAIEIARAAAEIAADLQRRITELEQRQVAAQATMAEQTRTRDALAAKSEYLHADLVALQTRRSAVLPDGGTVHDALAACNRQLADLDVWRAACSAQTNAEKSLAKQRSTFDERLLDSDFDGVSDLRSAIMSAPEIAAAEGLNRAYAERRAITADRLRDPHLLEAAQAEPPDLECLRADAQLAHSVFEEIQERYRTASRRRERLADLIDELQQALDAWEPLRAARDRAADVAAMCAGTSPDNQTRTKLSHYVLGARLQQVVEAANIRLLSISSGRYQLLHTMLKGVGDTRGGLGLRVLDTYTGQERDPATLSGGETFYVSLALALGLADLVRDEIGGTELSTLFVDEGFGSLDADTLDEVLDEVDSLRSGGRCVGLVSHLSELRRRIPTQVRIVPSPRGSKVSPR